MELKCFFRQVEDQTFASLFGERLRQSRKALGLNQDEIAQRVGVVREQWGRYERGGSVPGGEVLARAADAGVDVRFVITGDRDYAPPEPLSADEQTLLAYWRAASYETRKAAMGALVGASTRGSSKAVFHGTVGAVYRSKGDVNVGGSTMNVTMPAKPRKKPP